MDSHFRPQLYSATAFVMLRYLSFAPLGFWDRSVGHEPASLRGVSITKDSFQVMILDHTPLDICRPCLFWTWCVPNMV